MRCRPTAPIAAYDWTGLPLKPVIRMYFTVASRSRLPTTWIQGRDLFELKVRLSSKGVFSSRLEVCT